VTIVVIGDLMADICARLIAAGSSAA